MTYYLNPLKQYKIWFSTNRDVFLGMENQLRFIRSREKNKEAHLSFIYSGKCLSKEALEQLQAFCKKYKIKPIDFDTEIQLLCESNTDKKIYELAKTELDRTLNISGGNIAAPSDLVRLLPGVVNTCGIYSDFDVELDFTGLMKTKILSPILLHCSTLHPVPSISNEIVAAAYEDEQMTKLSRHAIDMLEYAKKSVINHYENAYKAILEAWHPDLQSPLEQLCPMSYMIATAYFKKNPGASVFDFRTYANNLSIQDLRKLAFAPCYLRPNLSEAEKAQVSDQACKENFGQYYYSSTPDWCDKFKAKDCADLTDKLIQLFKHRLIVSSVLGVSGPKAFMHAFEHCFPVKIDSNSGDYMKFKEEVSASSIRGNNLSKHIWKKSGNIPTDPLEQIGATTDFSWSILGAKNQLQRNTLFAEKAVIIQHAYQNYKSIKMPK